MRRGEPLARPRADRTTARPLHNRPRSGLLPHGGRIEEGGTARAAPARTGPRPARCTIATAPRFGLLPHGGRIEEGGTARAAPARTGQHPARCTIATAPRFGLLPHGGRIEEGGTTRAAPRADRTTARPLHNRYAPRLGLLPRGGRIEEGGTARARPPRGQDKPAPARGATPIAQPASRGGGPSASGHPACGRGSSSERCPRRRGRLART